MAGGFRGNTCNGLRSLSDDAPPEVIQRMALGAVPICLLLAVLLALYSIRARVTSELLAASARWRL